jgi:hypothetical protein
LIDFLQHVQLPDLHFDAGRLDRDD